MLMTSGEILDALTLGVGLGSRYLGDSMVWFWMPDAPMCEALETGEGDEEKSVEFAFADGGPTRSVPLETFRIIAESLFHSSHGQKKFNVTLAAVDRERISDLPEGTSKYRECRSQRKERKEYTPPPGPNGERFVMISSGLCWFRHESGMTTCDLLNPGDVVKAEILEWVNDIIQRHRDGYDLMAAEERDDD